MLGGPTDPLAGRGVHGWGFERFASLFTSNTILRGMEPGRGAWKLEPAPIRAHARIGANSTIRPGVTVGSDAVVGAGAVVTRDVAPRTVVAGNPARVLRKLRPGELAKAPRRRKVPPRPAPA